MSSLLFRSDDSDSQPNAGAEILLGDHFDERRFCAWAVRDLRGRGKTKVPFQGKNNWKGEIEAKSNDPTTWLTISDAVGVAEAIKGGIGVFLGVSDIVAGYRLGGVDLDSCVGADNAISPWAAEAIDRLNSYTEKSPSGSGYKILFLYRTEDIPAVLKLMGNAKTGKQYKEYGKGKEHPPGFEFYITGRFFALTGEHLASTPLTVRSITYADFEWLVRDLGPRVSGKPASHYTPTARGCEPVYPSGGGYDQSRSGRALSRARQLRRVDGLVSYAEIKDALLYDPDHGVRDWMAEKGLANGDREFKRIFDKSMPKSFSDEIRCEYAQAQRQVRLGVADDPWAIMLGC